MRVGAAINVIPIHFDVPGHEIPLSTFVTTSEQTRAVIRAFSDELFEGQLQFQVLVLPPAEGSFLARLGIVIIGGWGIVWTFTESDIGQGFIKGLTGHEPAYWAEHAGELTRALLTETPGPEEEQERSFEQTVAGTIVCESVRSFLSTPNRELVVKGIEKTRFRAAYEAKNAFYEICALTPQVRGVGFDERPIFPIQRDQFPEHHSTLPPPEEVDELWFATTAVLRVTSPNWDRSDRARQWKGRDHQGRDRYFRIEDEEFWNLVEREAISTHIIDTMKVQWAYQGRPEQPKNCRVLKVLEFNELTLATPLPDDELAVRLGELRQAARDQGDLFG